MPTDRRTEEEIRREITTEREHLREALADLRAGVDAKRRPAALVGGAIAAGLAAAVVARMTRRLRNG